MSEFIIYIVIGLGILAISQLVRVFELSTKLRGKQDEEVSDRDNNTQGTLMLLFMFAYFGFFLWLVLKTSDQMLPPSASKHGDDLDWLLNFNFLIITIAFVLTHIVLFWFAFKYRGKKSNKAEYITHNNKLELLWTSVPAIFLAVIIIYGLTTWNEITDDAPEDSIVIELFSRQFDWHARYAGADSTLGKASYNVISAKNPLGVITTASIAAKKDSLLSKIAKEELALYGDEERGIVGYDPESKRGKEMIENIEHWKRHLGRVDKLGANDVMGATEAGNYYKSGEDDVIVAGEFHIPVGQPVKFLMRSQDVIHSAYMPHFRQQMNTVPGMTTTFWFVPTITTEEMRQKINDPKFDYLLYCNKICGAAHYNMKMTIVVETQEEYEKWMASQAGFETGGPAEETEEKAEGEGETAADGDATADGDAAPEDEKEGEQPDEAMATEPEE